MVDQLGDHFQTGGGVLGFQDFLLLFGTRIDGRSDHIRQGARLLDRTGHLGNLPGQPGRKLHDAYELFNDIGHQGLGLIVLVLDILEMLHFGPQVGLALHEFPDLEAAQTLDQHLGFIVVGFGHLQNQGAAAHPRQIAIGLGTHVLLFFGHHQTDNAVLGHGFIHQFDGILFHYHQRQDHLGKQGGVKQRQYGKRGRKIIRIVLDRGFILRHPNLLQGDHKIKVSKSSPASVRIPVRPHQPSAMGILWVLWICCLTIWIVNRPLTKVEETISVSTLEGR